MNENGFEKKVKTATEDVAEAMQEGLEKIRTLQLSSSDVGQILQANDVGVEQMLADRGFNFNDHYIRVKTDRGESEQYMKSAAELRTWLIRTSAN
ncbi:MAG: hypothetical protein JWN64_367 [Parcubacteria group bacterium]|nr:hypothetical protein [Parcubacteria group bacterium]